MFQFFKILIKIISYLRIFSAVYLYYFYQCKLLKLQKNIYSFQSLISIQILLHILIMFFVILNESGIFLILTNIVIYNAYDFIGYAQGNIFFCKNINENNVLTNSVTIDVQTHVHKTWFLPSH